MKMVKSFARSFTMGLPNITMRPLMRLVMSLPNHSLALRYGPQDRPGATTWTSAQRTHPVRELPDSRFWRFPQRSAIQVFPHAVLRRPASSFFLSDRSSETPASGGCFLKNWFAIPNAEKILRKGRVGRFGCPVAKAWTEPMRHGRDSPFPKQAAEIAIR